MREFELKCIEKICNAKNIFVEKKYIDEINITLIPSENKNFIIFLLSLRKQKEIVEHIKLKNHGNEDCFLNFILTDFYFECKKELINNIEDLISIDSEIDFNLRGRILN
jgi:hypothetical protein